MIHELEVILSYKYDEKHKKAADQITKLYKEKFDIDIYKILFQYDDTMDMLSYSKKGKVYPSKNSKLRQMFFYFKSSKQLHDYERTNDNSPYVYSESNVDNMNEFIKPILESCGFDISKFLRALYRSLEILLLEQMYADAYVDFQNFTKDIFNPQTMAYVDRHALIIVYKTNELLEKAYSSGEIVKLKADYYKFIKNFDQHNFITKDCNGNYSGLITRFDSTETIKCSPSLYSRFYYEYFCETMGENLKWFN